MTEFIDVVKGRRSIRRYKDKEVPENLLNRVLDAVRWSPSWNNTQCWEIVVVRDGEGKRRLQDLVPTVNPAHKAVVQAPVVLVLCGKLERSGYYMGQPTTKFGDWFMFDLGIAVQTLCLTAHDLGLGTVIVGLFDHGRTAQVLKVPEGHAVVALIPLGYPDKISTAPKRREIGEFSHFERF